MSQFLQEYVVFKMIWFVYYITPYLPANTWCLDKNNFKFYDILLSGLLFDFFQNYSVSWIFYISNISTKALWKCINICFNILIF